MKRDPRPGRAGGGAAGRARCVLRAAGQRHAGRRAVGRRARSTPARSPRCSRGRGRSGSSGSPSGRRWRGPRCAVLLGVPAAHLLHRREFRGRGVLRALLLVPFVLPTVVVGVAFRELIGEAGPLGFLGFDGSAGAIIAGLVFFNVAVVIRAVGAAWESLDPRPAEAAASLGAGPVHVFLTVTLPALRPAIVSAASVVFLFCATAFGVVLTLGGLRYSSVETEIYLLTTNLLDLQAAAALSIVQLLAITALLLRHQPAARRTRPDPGALHRAPAAGLARRLAGRARDAARGRARRAADRGAGVRLAAGRRRLGPRQLPRADDRGVAPGAAGAGDPGPGHVAAHRGRRHLDVARPSGCWSRSSSPDGRGAGPSAGCAACSTGCSCSRSASPR